MNYVYLTALVAAAGPLLIHLLNRRRHRTVHWAAMDFLRDAIRRNKRLVELRDWLLLALRTLAVVLFVLAMVRPSWVSDGAGSRNQPVHAILVMDNSLSMGYTQLDKSQLDVAREKAKEFVQKLHKGSEVSIIPLCGQQQWHVDNVYATTEDALEALDRVHVVDRAALATDGAEMARRAMREASEIPTKRVVFLGDMQDGTWGASDLSEYFEPLGDLQIVDVGAGERSNTSITDFRLRDGVADGNSPATFVATINHESTEPRRVRVTLKVDDVVADERFIDLVPSQSRQLVFKYNFDVAGTPGEPLFVPVRLEITSDQLPLDDFRTCVAPVVARLPVLFIDQQGDREDPDKLLYGETWPLRRLLAPVTSLGDSTKQLVDIRHVRPDEVSRDDLKHARLVVMAGVTTPSATLVRDLREYAQQGGQVFLAAGGDFDPIAWNDTAWLDGAGILPAPLQPQPIGRLPNASVNDWPRFRLAANTCKDEVFQMSLAEGDLQDLLDSPFFYKAVAVDEEALKKFDDAERSRQEAMRSALDEFQANQKRWSELEQSGELTTEEIKRRDDAERALLELTPDWLAWSNHLAARQSTADFSVDQLVARSRPQIMGRYDNGDVFAVRRRVGDGQIMMLTSGCYPVWNNIAADKGASVLILDQMIRNLLTAALPDHTFEPAGDITIPIDSRDAQAQFTLLSPGEEDPQPIPVEAVGESDYGLVLRSLPQRGLYRVGRAGESDEDDPPLTLAVNGPAAESDLATIDRESFETRLGLSGLRWVELDDPISLEGETMLGRDIWKYLMLGALGCLLLEMFLLLPKVTARMTGNVVPQEATAEVT